MPDVKLPDGTVIRNVPEGTTKAQLMARLHNARAGTGGRTAHPTLVSRALDAIGMNSPKVTGFGDSRAFGMADEIGAAFDTLGIGGSGEDRPNIWKGNNPVEAWRANQRRNAQQMAQREQQDPAGYLGGQIAGAVLPGAAPRILAGTGAGQRVGAAGRALSAAPKSAAGRAVARAAVAAAPDVARGAAYGAGSADGGLAERTQGAVEGAGLGLAGHTAGKAVGRVASRVMRGSTVSPAVRTLADEGVVMTPGKRGGSIRKTYEEGFLGSLPFLKAIPGAANRRSVEQLNVAFYNRVLKPLGQKLPMSTTPGREAVAALGNTVYGAYDKAIAPLTLGMDSGITGAAKALKKGAPGSVGAGAQQLTSIIDSTLAPLKKGPVSGTRVRDIMKDLRGQASKFKKFGATANENNIGDELWKLHDQLDTALARQNGGAALKDFANARESVSLLKRVEDAAAKAKDGVATPQNFSTAVSKRGYGTSTSKVARGKASMQDLADAASQILPSTTPNSGTPERITALGALAGGPTAIAHFIDPTMGGLAGASLLPYAPGIDRVLQNLALNRPAPMVRLGDIIERAGPALGTAGAQAALSQGR